MLDHQNGGRKPKDSIFNHAASCYVLQVLMFPGSKVAILGLATLNRESLQIGYINPTIGLMTIPYTMGKKREFRPDRTLCWESSYYCDFFNAQAFAGQKSKKSTHSNITS